METLTITYCAPTAVFWHLKDGNMRHFHIFSFSAIDYKYSEAIKSILWIILFNYNIVPDKIELSFSIESRELLNFVAEYNKDMKSLKSELQNL